MTTTKNAGEEKRDHKIDNNLDKDMIKEQVIAAHEQAEADIEQDPDLNAANDPGADLDEGELARLDNDNDRPDLV